MKKILFLFVFYFGLFGCTSNEIQSQAVSPLENNPTWNKRNIPDGVLTCWDVQNGHYVLNEYVYDAEFSNNFISYTDKSEKKQVITFMTCTFSEK